MKYLGEKSVSSFLSKLLFVCWYLVLVISVLAVTAGILFVIFIPFDGPVVLKIADIFNLDLNNPDWAEFKRYPIVVSGILLPYFGIFITLVLKIIKRLQCLFNNFNNDIVFSKSNVDIILKISKLLIVSSILTFNFYSLIISLFLLILCEIFKNGTALQEEQDLTI